MGGIGVLLLGILLYQLSKKAPGSNGVSGDKSPPRFNRVTSLVFLTLPFIFIFVSDFNNYYGVLFVYFLGCLMCAGFIANFFSYCGWYKAAYTLGRFNIFRGGRNPAAMDYYRGYIAAKRLKQSEKQREALLWLRARYHKRDKTMYSGEMVMYLIIDSHLTHPQDPEYLARRLSILKGIATASIPRVVSILGLKCALLPALSRADWTEIHEIACQWDTPAPNRLAKYLKKYESCYVLEQSISSRILCWLREINLWRYRELIAFAKSCAELQKQVIHVHSQLSPKELLFTHQNSVFEEEARGELIDDLIGDSAKQSWLARAEELGGRRVDEVWKKIENSVLQCSGLERQGEYIVDDVQYDYIERQQKSIRYVEASIAKNLEEKVGGTTLEHFLDWVSILHILNELKINKNEQQVAFTMVYNVIWDWVADLWNIRNEYCLAHFIATVCAPLAYECGINEMGNVLSGVASGKYK